MNSTYSLIITALLLVVAAVVIGCESDQKTNTAPSVVTVGTVYANMTATANSDQTTNNRLSTEEFLEQHRKTWNSDKVIESTAAPTSAPIPAKPSGKRFDPGTPNPTPTPARWSISGNSATASARAEAQRGADRNRNEVPSCFPNCPTPVPTAPLPTPLPTLATTTGKGFDSGESKPEPTLTISEANEALRNYFWDVQAAPAGISRDTSFPVARDQLVEVLFSTLIFLHEAFFYGHGLVDVMENMPLCVLYIGAVYDLELIALTNPTLEEAVGPFESAIESIDALRQHMDWNEYGTRDVAKCQEFADDLGLLDKLY